MEGVKFSASQLDSLKQFVKYIKFNPSVLDESEELAFFKDFLINDCGATKLVSTPIIVNTSTTVSNNTTINSTTSEYQDEKEEESDGFLIKEVKTKSLIVEVDEKKEEKPVIVEEKNVMKEMTNVSITSNVEETSTTPKIPLISEPSNATKEKIIEPEKETVLTTNDSKYLSIMNMSDSTSNVKEKNMKVANECIKKGNELFKKNEYQLAAIYYGKAIECSNGESAMTFIKRAECLAMLNKPLSVRRDCDQAIKLNPDAGKAYNLRGKALLALGKVDLAKKDLEMFKKLNGDISNMDKVDKLIDQINDIRSVEKKEEKPSTTSRNNTTKQQTNSSNTPSQTQTPSPTSSTTKSSSTSSSNANSSKPSSSSGGNSNSGSSSSGANNATGQVPNFVNPHVMKLVAGDEYLMRGFQNPRLVNAINEIAMNPSAFLKYNHDIEVVTMFKKFTEIIGKANK